MKKIIFTESQIKNVLKQYINEIEKYTPSIDSPEDEEELKKTWGIKEKDPYKLKNPFKSLKSDDFYDTKLDDYKTKEKLKQTGLSKSLMSKATGEGKPSSDLTYLDMSKWQKTSNETPYYDKFKGELSPEEKEAAEKEKQQNFGLFVKKLFDNRYNNDETEQYDNLYDIVKTIVNEYPNKIAPISHHYNYDSYMGLIEKLKNWKFKYGDRQKKLEFAKVLNQRLKNKLNKLLPRFNDAYRTNEFRSVLDDVAFYVQMYEILKNMKK